MNVTKASGSNRSKPYLKIDRLSKKFGGFTALDTVSLEVFEGEFVCFLGPSGCGKTTLIRAIAGLDIQTSGTVEQAGKDISALPPSERDFGIVFQSYALFPNLTVENNVAFGLENQKISKPDIRKRVSELLELVGLTDQGSKFPAQLSGGQQQRVALSRALATAPGLLLLDEPLSALDAKVRMYLRHEMKALQRRLGVTTIMVTHDQEEALTMADRIVVMNCGLIEQVGTPTEIYREPRTLFVADFIGAMNQVIGQATSDNQVRIGGLLFATKSHGLVPDAPLIMAIRPEDIIPRSDEAVSPGVVGCSTHNDNSFVATVKDMEFLGSFWRVLLTCSMLGEATLTADMSINEVRRLNIAIGASIAVELPKKRIWVFPHHDTNA